MSPRPRPDADDSAALTPVAINILLALADRSRHGLGIAEHVETFTGGRMTLGPGTLYGGMKRLLELGLVEDSPGGSGEDPRRRHYRITPAGRRALEREARQMAAVVGVAKVKRVI